MVLVKQKSQIQELENINSLLKKKLQFEKKAYNSLDRKKHGLELMIHDLTFQFECEYNYFIFYFKENQMIRWIKIIFYLK
jgi:hypothetical protein